MRGFMIIRLHILRRALTLETGDVIFSYKRIISLILRGFSNDQIYEFAQELFYFWDHPTYWQDKKEGNYPSQAMTSFKTLLRIMNAERKANE